MTQSSQTAAHKTARTQGIALPADEVERLEALRRYGILDTGAEHSFDDLARLAAHVCDASMALITFIDEDRQWFKSKVGIEIRQTSREEAFCSHAILQSGVFIVSNTLADERFASSRLVTAEPHVRFYAGAPLVTADKHALGTICVLDYEPRELSEEQAEALSIVARQVITQLELRRLSVEQARVNEELRREVAVRREVEQRLRLFESAMQQAKESIVITTGQLDLPGPEIISVNSAFTQTTGYTKQEMIGKTPRILQGPETDRSVLDLLRRNLSHGQPFEGEVINYRKDGTTYFNRWQVSPVRNEAGEVTHFISVQSDVTQRKRIEARLAESHAQIQKSRDDMLSILNHLSLGTAMTDEAGRVTFLSLAAQTLLDKSDQECIGKQWADVFGFQEQEKQQLRQMIERPACMRTKVVTHTEASKGRRYWMEVDVQDDPREPRRKMFLLYDVTEVHDLRRLLDEKAQLQELVGKSKSMQNVFQQIRDVAQVDSTVLIEGETGTGKELAARAIHFSGNRKQKPFIAINCAGLTDSLLTSQLFGHARGAFTGAIKDHVGFFEAANGGTLFLDEIGDIPMNVQTNLLRVLQEKEIVRLGESRPRKVDVRVLAATHRNLDEEVAKGNFRTDLLYRIRVFRIKLPPLRERREDIPLLVAIFLGQFRATTGKQVEEVGNEAMRLLLEYNWPGNVRELRSVIEVAVIRCKGPVIRPEDLPPETVDSIYSRTAVSGAEDEEKRRLLTALRSADGNRDAAARLLGVSRATFYRRLARLGITNQS